MQRQGRQWLVMPTTSGLPVKGVREGNGGHCKVASPALPTALEITPRICVRGTSDESIISQHSTTIHLTNLRTRELKPDELPCDRLHQMQTVTRDVEHEDASVKLVEACASFHWTLEPVAIFAGLAGLNLFAVLTLVLEKIN